nr:hypothetical protein [Tanacetum cinerariifolium]
SYEDIIKGRKKGFSKNTYSRLSGRAYDGEVNLKFDENLILNEFAVKLCLDYEVKKGKKMVKKELIVALKRELYFVKFIINPEGDDSEPRVILRRSFLRLAHGVIDFGNRVITIYPEPDPIEDDSKKTRKSSDDWDQLLDFNFDDVPMFAGSHLTQEEAEKGALAVKISQKFVLLEERRPTMKEEEDAVKRIKGKALKEKDDPGTFIFPIRFDVLRTAKSDSDDEEEYVIKRNRDTQRRSQIVAIQMPKTTQNSRRGVASISSPRVLAMGRMEHEAGSDEEIFTYVALIRTFNINEPIYFKLCHEFYSTYEFDERTTGYDKIQKNDLWFLSMFDARHQNGYANVAWFISKLARKCRVLIEDVVRSLSTLIYYRDLDTTMLRDLIKSDGKLTPEDLQPGVPRVGIPRPPRASIQDLYDRMGRMEICPEAIEHMKYRQSYH